MKIELENWWKTKWRFSGGCLTHWSCLYFRTHALNDFLADNPKDKAVDFSTAFYDYNSFSPNKDPIRATATEAVLFFSSKIGFTSTNSADVIIPDSANISIAKWLSR
jgi:hypothetical protein